LLLIIGLGITGMDIWNGGGKEWFDSLMGKNGTKEQIIAGIPVVLLPGGGLAAALVAYFKLKR